MRFMVDRRSKKVAISSSPLLLAASTLEMPAPAGSHKRSRADFELEGAPAEADSLELLDNLLEEEARDQKPGTTVYGP